MNSLDDIFESLPRDLADADILIDCETTPVELVDLASLLDELLVRSKTRSITLLHPTDDLAVEALRMAQSIGCADRVHIET